MLDSCCWKQRFEFVIKYSQVNVSALLNCFDSLWAMYGWVVVLVLRAHFHIRIQLNAIYKISTYYIAHQFFSI